VGSGARRAPLLYTTIKTASDALIQDNDKLIIDQEGLKVTDLSLRVLYHLLLVMSKNSILKETIIIRLDSIMSMFIGTVVLCPK